MRCRESFNKTDVITAQARGRQRDVNIVRRYFCVDTGFGEEHHIREWVSLGFVFKKSWIGFHCIITTTGGVGTHCFHSQVKYFVLQMPSGSSHSLHQGGEKMFLILQRANQNIPYYVCDASNPSCGLEFSFPQKTGVTRSIYSPHKATSRLIWKTFPPSLLFLCFTFSLSFSPLFFKRLFCWGQIKGSILLM